MRNRKLVAAFACRANGSRLYGKPLQNLDIGSGMTILDFIIEGAKQSPEIENVVLGISEEPENRLFMDFAKKHKVGYILGDPKDVLMRLIQCGRIAGATDIFRITTECPFVGWEFLTQAWKLHQETSSDITVTEFLPEGVNFEIYKLDALEISHQNGNDKERSELCSLYARNNPDKFKINILKPSKDLQRLDLRLTVDYPEDLILCRAIYNQLKDFRPKIPISKIVKFLDENPKLHELVASFVHPHPAWTKGIYVDFKTNSK